MKGGEGVGNRERAGSMRWIVGFWGGNGKAS